MEPSEFAAVREAFEAALQLTPPAREALLAERLGERPELLAQVRAMLAADGTAGAFLEPPGEHTTAGVVQRTSSLGPAERGDVVGGFTLLRPLGTGGMGEVWEAEQASPRRRVALKLLRDGLSSERSRQRFEDEAELLARLSHPGIAGVLAAGLLEPAGTEGAGRRPPRPWFALELVEDARSLTDYARGRPLAERLGLLVQACEAVHHGHLNGVVHRDLKPDNLLVDPSGRLKVIDFGIARATEDGRGHTLGGELVGTLAYMAPEQVEGRAAEVDARADVYALGVVLYELLAGRSPWRSETSAWAALAQEVTDGRATPPSDLASDLSRELDWVVARAMEHDPAHRYPSAHELGAELRRFLAQEPLAAGPPTAAYRARKFARRNRGLVLGSGLALALILAGAAGTSWGWLRSLDREAQLRIAKTAAEEAEGRAVERAERARALNDFLDRMLRGANPLAAHLGLDSEASVGDMLQRAAAEIEAAFPGRPVLEADTRLLIGVSLHGQGRYADAAEQLERARELLAELGLADAPEGLRARRLLGIARVRLGQDALGLELLRSAWAVGATSLDPSEPERGALEADLAWALMQMGQHAEALGRARSALRQLDAGGPELAPMALGAAATVARCLRELGDPAAAEQAYRDTLARAIASTGPDSVAAGITHSNLGAFLFGEGRAEQARSEFERGIELQRAGLGPDNPLLAAPLYNLATVLQTLGDYAGAERAVVEALELLERAFGPDHPETLDARMALAEVLWYQARYGAAEVEFRTCAERLEASGRGGSRQARLAGLRVLEMRCFGEDAAEARAAAAELGAWPERLAAEAEVDPELVEASQRAVARVAALGL